MYSTPPMPIEKDGLKHCTFQKPVYRFTDFQLRERDRSLYLAMLLGNNFDSRARIVFNTPEGYKEISSTIWATTEKYILLNGGSTIPLDSIAEVELEQQANGILESSF